jgi:hypothetical protein
MAHPFYMPFRGEETAPVFDKSRSREFPRFFDDLEHLFTRANITTEAEKKRWLLRYVDFETEQSWKALPEFRSATTSYADFKKAILVFYPDASGDYVYSVYDLNLLVQERLRLGITLARDLSDYHLQFIAISSWLIQEQQLDNLEQRRAYIRGF